MHTRRWNRKGLDTILAALLLVIIVVVMSVLVYSWSTGVLGAIAPPPPSGREQVTLEYQAYTGNNNVTLYLRNTGSAVTTLTGYYVQDINGNTYAKTSWSGPTIQPTSLAKAYILIPSACSGCILTGSSFVFQPGATYNIVVETQRNNQFTFTILR